MKKMKINTYLAESDSDFMDHNSVKNEKVDKSYKRDYVLGSPVRIEEPKTCES